MKFIFAVAAALPLVAAEPVAAALVVGSPAPVFTAPGADNGKISTIELSQLLGKGPVVVFFIPSAFTDGPECREFALNIDTFRAAGAQVVGVSRDRVDTLARFSAEECAGKFPMVSAEESLINAFDVNDGAMFNTRTTYVIAPSGKIAFVRDGDDDYAAHVKSALAFVQAMKK